MLSLFAILLANMTATAPAMDERFAAPANVPEVHFDDQIIGPFALQKTERGQQVELLLTIVRPLSRTYRYELVINGSSKVHNSGRAGPSARVGATLCHLSFSGAGKWSGTVIITDEAGKSEVLKL